MRPRLRSYHTKPRAREPGRMGRLSRKPQEATMTVALILLLQFGDLSKVEIKTQKVGGSVSMLQGAGGNIGVSAGEDGVFIIDDEFKELAPKIKTALAAISKKPLRFIFNTHWHGDHTGANEQMASGGAVIVAHDNVRK